MTEFIIPKQCRECPVQSNLGGRHTALGRVGVAIMEDAKSLSGLPGQVFDEMVDDLALPEACADVLKVETRKNVAEAADMIDEQQLATQADAAACAQTCDGPLKMRASKGGTTYTATLCTSGLIYPIYGALAETVPVAVQVDYKTPKQWFKSPHL